ncbi:hypothetical protein OROHE_007176 [Orobanche hederae]
MASSQTSSKSQNRRDNIIDGRLSLDLWSWKEFSLKQKILIEMERIVSRIKQQDMYLLGSQYFDFYDERIIEEFYLDASVKLFSLNQGGDVCNITATVRGIHICIDHVFLETMFRLPSDGLKSEELETFGSQDLLYTY